MLNAGNMHMRKGIIEPESVTLLKPLCSLELAAAAVSSNKACGGKKMLNRPTAHASQANLLSLHCCDIFACCQAVQMYCCVRNCLGLRNIVTQLC